jgi:UDP-N-acetylglucosamine diphosphorylase/glucosamine-1-phosphate N-acetyltransferase
LRIFEKIQRLYPDVHIAFSGNDKALASFIKRENIKNEILSGVRTLILNSNIVLDGILVSQIQNVLNSIPYHKASLLFVNEENEILAYYVHNFYAEEYSTIIKQSENTFVFKRVKLHNTKVINYIWEALDYQGKQIERDAALMKDVVSYFDRTIYKNVTFVNNPKIKVGKNVKIAPGVVIDATNGYVLIDDDAQIMHNAVLIGPCYVGKNTTIKIGAKIYENCSFGEYCKIGGDVENSTFHSFSSKQHDGFVGHSYICEWVNLGAGTSTSDLNNRYIPIKMQLPHKLFTTDKQFIGAMIGDHSKTAINTSLNTGTVIGVSSMIANGGLQPKYVPSFRWLADGEVKKYDVEKAIETATSVMARRNKKLTSEEENILRTAANSKY